MNVLLIDIGNTRIKWARLEGGTLGRMDGRVHADEQLSQAIAAAFEGPAPSRVVVCNVAGPLVGKALSDYGHAPFVKVTKRTLTVLADNPPANQLTNITSLLHRDLSDAR